MASFGMMNQAYFVGKNILIDWINNFLEINIDKVECCANGAIYCNLWDALHPGTIPMSRVDFTVKHEYDYTKNWKLLQNGFQKAGIEKVIPVQRLIKARYQDNLEFLQWMYKYSRDTYNGDPDDPTYDAIGRRQKSKGGRDYTGSSNSNNRNNRRGKENRNAHRPTSAATRNNNQYRSGTQSQRGSITQNNKQRGGGMNNMNNNQNMVNIRELEELQKENQRLTESRNAIQLKYDALQQEHDELSNVAKDIEVERDFYFNKVVAIEQVLKKEQDQNTPLLKAIYELLYQTEEDQQKPQQQQANNNVVDQQMNDNMNSMNNMQMNDMQINDNNI